MKESGFLSVLVLGGWMLVLISGCASLSPTPSQRDFSTANLLVDTSVFPSGWVAGPVESEKPHTLGYRNNIGGSSVQFGNPSGTIGWHQVARFRNAQDAAVAYQDQDYLRDTRGPYGSKWETPTALSYQSPVANQFRVACDRSGQSFEICVAMAQYEEYLSVLCVHMSPGYMTYDDLERILKAIDERMAHYLGKASK